MLRTVQPLPNRYACHECHDSSHRMNGVLIVDIPVTAAMLRVKANVRQLAAGTAAVGLLLILGIGIAVRRSLLHRLYHFEETARAITDGDLAQRVPVEGDDAVTRLERQFNAMADSVGGLLDQVREQRRSLQRIIDSVDDGIVVIDRDLRVAAANEAAARRLDCSPTELIGTAWPSAVQAPRCACGDGDRGCEAPVCFARESVHTELRVRQGPDGTSHHEEVRSSPVRAGDDGRITYVVEAWRDITDRRSAEARLADYQRMASVGVLASGFSHEINTPLASIASCLRRIDKNLRAATPSGATDANGSTDAAGSSDALRQSIRLAGIATEQLGRCSSLMQQFLQLVRGNSARPAVTDLAATTRELVDLVRPTAAEAGVRIDVLDPQGLPNVMTSVAELKQVLLNLVLNAVQSSEPDTTVSVEFAWHDTVRLLVRDQGCGIAAQDVERNFYEWRVGRVEQRCERAGATRTRSDATAA